MEQNEIYKSNLLYIRQKEDAVQKMLQAQYEQIAAGAYRHWRREIDTDKIAALYLTGDPDSLLWELTPEEEKLCTPDFARFCSCFSRYLPADSLLMTEKNDLSDELPEEEPETFHLQARTAYMQNSYTDKAWRQFSGVIPDMTAEYFSGYPAVCEEVYNGLYRYCILPLYTSADGQLVSFRKLMDKYDLKICLETEVEMADESVMRFALLCRKLRRETEGLLPQYMDISVVLPENGSIGALIASCEALGAAVTSVYTIPLEYAATPEFCLELRLNGADPAALALFLEASQLRCTIVGLYSMI